MKKIIISLAALAALSTASLAERSQDLRDTDTYTGKFSSAPVQSNIEMLAMQTADAPATGYFYGRYGLTTDMLEVRRWDEKNSN